MYAGEISLHTVLHRHDGRCTGCQTGWFCLVFAFFFIIVGDFILQRNAGSGAQRPMNFVQQTRMQSQDTP